MKNFKKILALALVAVLLVGATFAATVAWMTAEADEKKNVFTVGDIDIELTEDTDIIGDGGEINKTPDGSEYIGVMPGDRLVKEVSITNTGDVPAYVALTVDVNNAAKIAAAIEGYDPAYTPKQILTVYNDVFENWGMQYADGVLSNVLPTNTELLKVETEVANDQWNLTYYLHLDPNETFVPFTGLNAPAYFDNKQMEMFQGLTILVDASAIQADNFATSDEAFAALAGETEIIVPEAVVTTATELENAIANGKTIIQLGDDIQGNVTVPMSAGTEYIIDGNGKTYEGSIVVDGKSATIMTSGLTIQDVVFKNATADACIQLGDGTNATRYTCNVTIKNCTFDAPGAVGVKSYTGGDKNLTITGCTATANAHSLAQLKGIDGVLVENCTVNSVRGINFNNSDNVTVKDCTIDVQKYAVRFGESANSVVENYAVTNCVLKSQNIDGDAAIVLRAGATNANLDLTGTTISATVEMTGHENANITK